MVIARYTLDPADTVSVGTLTDFDTVAELLADTRLTYGGGFYNVAAGRTLTAGGFRYEVALSYSPSLGQFSG